MDDNESEISEINDRYNHLTTDDLTSILRKYLNECGATKTSIMTTSHTLSAGDPWKPLDTEMSIIQIPLDIFDVTSNATKLGVMGYNFLISKDGRYNHKHFSPMIVCYDGSENVISTSNITKDDTEGRIIEKIRALMKVKIPSWNGGKIQTKQQFETINRYLEVIGNHPFIKMNIEKEKNKNISLMPSY